MPPPQNDLASSVRVATFRLARRLRAEKADDELSDAQFSVLVHLTTDGPLSLGQLAEREHVSAPSMNRTVNCLSDAGYLTRTGDDADRRRVSITLTEAGTTVVTDTVQRRDAWLRRSVTGLSGDEQATLRDAAALMVRMAGQ
ncbi:MarR family winged helix-turn-helix transcriptional regulator [Mycetocola reblochoni]|uniref:Transcriptional regulator, MarR family n=2 Tax=Mycetocola reblochoni TaxID=331618 RepID=A0A1R4IT76_9MICO|nr:MarR family transcriptional regulator [Mycetocola reblochoni]RLP71060.1 MarR family transcriptional regulator [Mycetocola reblochoni]SJN23057.1 Transcriptional regulator, MarR family [Mycetocola reblochoni REB411]